MGADERCAVRNSLYDLDLAKSRQSDHDLGFVLGLSDRKDGRLGGRPFCYPTFFAVVRFSAHADDPVLNHLRASK